ncbi:MAG TPA: hypothetical protein VM840_01780 [Actinomycetota bacterium]|nr:hypothetical protein [Actinomycetota bacterium]
MKLRRTALVLAVAGLVAVPAGPTNAAEDCLAPPVSLCVIQNQRQMYMFFSPSGSGNGELTVDATGAATISFFTQNPSAIVKGSAPVESLETTFTWGADHAARPAETTATVRGTIPLETNALGLDSIYVDLTLTGTPGDSSHRGTGCSVSDAASVGNGRSRQAAATGVIGDVTVNQSAAQVRSYDVCAAARR